MNLTELQETLKRFSRLTRAGVSGINAVLIEPDGVDVCLVATDGRSLVARRVPKKGSGYFISAKNKILLDFHCFTFIARAVKSVKISVQKTTITITSDDETRRYGKNESGFPNWRVLFAKKRPQHRADIVALQLRQTLDAIGEKDDILVYISADKNAPVEIYSRDGVAALIAPVIADDGAFEAAQNVIQKLKGKK